MAGERIARYLTVGISRFPELADGAVPTPWDPMPQAALDTIGDHLEERYGPVTRLTPLDLGVVKVQRPDGEAWVARVAPRGRPMREVEDDAAVLAVLERHALPAERLADPAPVSEVDGHGVLVTRFVPGKPPGLGRPYTRQLGEMLGRLHALDDPDLPERPGGGWHGLSFAGGGRAADLALLDELLDDVADVSPAVRADVETIRSALAALDLCEGLPEALAHVDLGGPNVLRAPKGEPVFIDWTGSGFAPRIANLAGVAWYLTETAMKEAGAGYREHVRLERDELDRLEGAMPTHALVLAAWGVVFRPETAAALVEKLPLVPTHAAKQATRLRRALGR